MSGALKTVRHEPEVAYVYSEPSDAADRHALPELAVVRLRVATKTSDGANVPAGHVGTIVMIHGGGKVYDVEFDSPAGVAAVGAEDVTLVDA